ncbi:hypothetical protein AB0I55_26900 [Actinocatenispora sera]|jgi:hypothetical protein|uniref:Uncharacterized protein n=1 Tax=Actinocatenispora sera TaxID=390989 RepID=A0A810KYZ1_9ACTN|nr:hypothetical protein [Actinocatenispora sera]BCJ28334.1 hypothetical protein Asera_24420 [Actinocatenispora sera]
MVDLIGFAVLAVVAGGAAWLLMRLAGWARRRGVGGALMGPAEEIWHPNAREFRFVIEAEAQQEIPRPPAGDPPTTR